MNRQKILINWLIWVSMAAYYFIISVNGVSKNAIILLFKDQNKYNKYVNLIIEILYREELKKLEFVKFVVVKVRKWWEIYVAINSVMSVGLIIYSLFWQIDMMIRFLNVCNLIVQLE